MNQTLVQQAQQNQEPAIANLKVTVAQEDVEMDENIDRFIDLNRVGRDG